MSESKRKPTSALFSVAYWCVKVITKILHPFTVEGLENLPESGALLCPNHASNWDPVQIIVALPRNYRLRVMGKKELFEKPVLSWLLPKLGGFPVDRNGRDIQAVKTAIQAIKSGDNLLIFPEGTVIRNGIGYVDGLPPHAHGGVSMIGIRTGATIIPVFVDGQKKLFHRTRLIFGEPYVPVYTGRHGTAEETQKIADEILEAAYALGGQKVGGEAL